METNSSLEGLAMIVGLQVSYIYIHGQIDLCGRGALAQGGGVEADTYMQFCGEADQDARQKRAHLQGVLAFWVSVTGNRYKNGQRRRFWCFCGNLSIGSTSAAVAPSAHKCQEDPGRDGESQHQQQREQPAAMLNSSKMAEKRIRLC